MKPTEIIRKSNLPKFLGFKRTQIDALIANGELRPIKLGPRAVGFLASEIAEWQQRKIEETQKKKA